MISLALVAIVALLWGALLNTLGYHLIRTLPVRSWCIHRCKNCGPIATISALRLSITASLCKTCYHTPWMLSIFIELLTVALCIALWVSPTGHYGGHWLFVSALIVSIRTDLESLLLSHYVTLYLIPIGALLAAASLLPVSLLESLAGAALGYGILVVTEKTTLYMTGKQGLGRGDAELLAMIGAFTGPLGCWCTLLIGSTLGAIIGMSYLIARSKVRHTKLPFGPFLACGALMFLLLQTYIISFLVS